MNREGLVGKAWRTIASHGIDRHELAEDVVDALLPQVTTVEELRSMIESKRLAPDALLVNADGHHARASEWTFLIWVKPLTVVWQP